MIYAKIAAGSVSPLARHFQRQPVRGVNMAGPTGIRNGKFKHGHNGAAGQSRTYKAWDNMITRCYRPSNSGYKHYGGKGILVCDRWRVFTNFLADMGECPPGLTIDRHDNSKGYEPGNCSWVTRLAQSHNSSKVKAVIRSDGKEYPTAIAAARDLNTDYAGIVKVCRGQRKTAAGYHWRYKD